MQFLLLEKPKVGFWPCVDQYIYVASPVYVVSGQLNFSGVQLPILLGPQAYPLIHKDLEGFFCALLLLAFNWFIAGVV